MDPRDPANLAKIRKQLRLQDRALIGALVALVAVVVIALILQSRTHSDGILIAGLAIAMAATVAAVTVWVVAYVRSNRSLNIVDPAGRKPRPPVWSYLVPGAAGLVAGGFYWALPEWRKWTWTAFVVAGVVVWVWVSTQRRGIPPPD